MFGVPYTMSLVTLYANMDLLAQVGYDHIPTTYEEMQACCEALKAADVVPDFRYPNVIRLAPVAQYTRFEDVYELVRRLVEIMETKAYLNYSDKIGPVA